ncbi:MAG TPA: ubiquinol-cytochrome c reductase iron-sulfur subunit [Verrucomicrobiae bacterium]|nr:ubiquinol-cytochrome c reductase iron-sulfur subunit [Verrucomicrobiae bacterium]
MNAELSNTVPPGPAKAEERSRREFLELLTLGLGAGATAVLVVPAVGFILAPLLTRNPQVWRSVGSIEDFKIDETVAVRFEDASALQWAGVTARTAAWLRREGPEKFVAFSINCTHLGCPVRWLPQADLFMCPCHGGVYYKDGSVAAGPPPKPLVRLPVRLLNGHVEILTAPIPIT